VRLIRTEIMYLPNEKVDYEGTDMLNLKKTTILFEKTTRIRIAKVSV